MLYNNLAVNEKGHLTFAGYDTVDLAPHYGTDPMILDELDKAIDSDISIDDICNTLFISRSKMIREFKKHYHTTPHAYLLDRKISFAKMLLQNSRHSIKAIAAHLCFADEKYFANVFKAKTGMTPSQYRKSKTNIST